MNLSFKFGGPDADVANAPLAERFYSLTQLGLTLVVRAHLAHLSTRQGGTGNEPLSRVNSLGELLDILERWPLIAIVRELVQELLLRLLLCILIRFASHSATVLQAKDCRRAASKH